MDARFVWLLIIAFGTITIVTTTILLLRGQRAIRAKTNDARSNEDETDDTRSSLTEIERRVNEYERGIARRYAELNELGETRATILAKLNDGKSTIVETLLRLTEQRRRVAKSMNEYTVKMSRLYADSERSKRRDKRGYDNDDDNDEDDDDNDKGKEGGKKLNAETRENDEGDEKEEKKDSVDNDNNENNNNDNINNNGNNNTTKRQQRRRTKRYIEDDKERNAYFANLWTNVEPRPIPYCPVQLPP